MLGPLGTIKQAREAAKTQHSQKYLKKKRDVCPNCDMQWQKALLKLERWGKEGYLT